LRLLKVAQPLIHAKAIESLVICHLMDTRPIIMKQTIQNLFQAVIFILIPMLFLLACQKKSGDDSVKSDIPEVFEPDSVNYINEAKIQSRKVVQQNDQILFELNKTSFKTKKVKGSNQSGIVYCNPKPVSYPGGAQELVVFLELNNSYKRHKYYESIEGIVYLKLHIDSTGTVIGSGILRGIGTGIDEEALRLAGLLKFLPAQDSTCKAISSEYLLKVSFVKPDYPRGSYHDVYTEEIGIPDEEIDISKDTKKDLWHLRKNAKPHYLGGKLKMRKYFKKNLAYPYTEIMEGNEGKVKLVLDINEIGKISDIKVYESAGEVFTQEAIRLVKSVKNWHPAIHKHRHATGYLTVRVKFKIPENLKMHIKR